jgi:hypothetical protein
MNESFISYLWYNRLFTAPLYTTDGQSISVINPGEPNTDAGPDFANARIKIGDEVWAGNVEIHVHESDWLKHNHANNQEYRTIILHVVHECDQLDNQLGPFPTVSVKDCYDPQLYFKYEAFMYAKTWIPCASSLSTSSDISRLSMAEKCIYERIDRKATEIEQIVSFTINNQEESFYILMARCFGLKVNSQAFEMLARVLPLKIILKHRDQLNQVEALLFGQSGLLADDPRDEYEFELKRTYSFLRKKYDLVPIPAHLWKFMRLMPPSFPTIRISQFAGLMHNNSHLLTKVLDCSNAQEIRAALNCSASAYWETHYQFGVQSKKSVKTPSDDFYNLLIINAVVPYLYLQGKVFDRQELKEKAIGFLYDLPAENNSITRAWNGLGIELKDAFNSQAFNEIKSKYCNQKRCLECRIGHNILGKGS